MEVGALETAVALAVVRQEDRYLVRLRESDDELNGLWEFPGGKLRDGESPLEGAVRECFEETGITVAAVEPLSVVRWRYEHGAVRLHAVLCRVEEGFRVQGSGFRKQGDDRSRIRWVTLAELCGLAMPAANEGILEELGRRVEGKTSHKKAEH